MFLANVKWGNQADYERLGIRVFLLHDFWKLKEQRLDILLAHILMTASLLIAGR